MTWPWPRTPCLPLGPGAASPPQTSATRRLSELCCAWCCCTSPHCSRPVLTKLRLLPVSRFGKTFCSSGLQELHCLFLVLGTRSCRLLQLWFCICRPQEGRDRVSVSMTTVLQSLPHNQTLDKLHRTTEGRAGGCTLGSEFRPPST